LEDKFGWLSGYLRFCAFQRLTKAASGSYHARHALGRNVSRVASLTVNPKDDELPVSAAPAADRSVTGGGEIPEGVRRR